MTSWNGVIFLSCFPFHRLNVLIILSDKLVFTSVSTGRIATVFTLELRKTCWGVQVDRFSPTPQSSNDKVPNLGVGGNSEVANGTI